MNTAAIINHGLCNIDSIARAVEECGGSPLITDQPHDLEKANRIILPGVGAFPDAMGRLREQSLDEAMQEQVVGKGIPFLGICLGMQLLGTKSWEMGETAGLGWIEGEVGRIEPYLEDTRVPHIGWNEVCFTDEQPLFKGINSGQDFYFVHSYHLCPRDEGNVSARTPYGRGIVSAVQREQIFGVQFHPEKSQRAGFQVLKNFMSL